MCINLKHKVLANNRDCKYSQQWAFKLTLEKTTQFIYPSSMALKWGFIIFGFVIGATASEVARAGDQQPYEKALTRWALQLKDEKASFDISSVEKIDLSSNVLFLVRGTRAWKDKPDSKPSDFVYLFQAKSPEEPWYELYRVSDRNRCGPNSFKDFKLSKIQSPDDAAHWQLDFRFVSFGCEGGGVTSNHKVINHFYLLLTEQPHVVVTYQSDFMINQELKFSPRKNQMLVYLLGDKPNESSKSNREFLLLWRPKGLTFEKPI